MNIRILNLPRDMTETQLLALFNPFGRVNSCSLVMDERTKKSKGFGFVEMESEKRAEAAIAALHGSTVNRKIIRVKPADEVSDAGSSENAQKAKNAEGKA